MATIHFLEDAERMTAHQQSMEDEFLSGLTTAVNPGSMEGMCTEAEFKDSAWHDFDRSPIALLTDEPL